MSKYSKYKIQTAQESPISKYAKYKIEPTRSQEESPSFLQRAAQLGKGALSGFGRAGLEEAANQTGAGVMEAGRGVIPISARTAEANVPRRGIESLEAMRPTGDDSLSNILYHAGEFGGGMGAFPMLPGRAAASTGVKSLLSRFGKEVGTGTAIGAGSGVLQEGGVNPLVADLTAASVNPKSILSNFKRIPEAATKGAHKIMGLGPKSLNIEAAQAARDLGIDLSAANLTDSTLTGLTDQWVGKTPFFGNKLKHKEAVADEQILKVLEDAYNKTGPVKTPEVKAEISRLYNVRAKELPKEAKILPTNFKEAIDSIDIDTAILSKDEESLLESLKKMRKEIEPQSKLVSPYGPIKLPLQDFSVKRLVGTKKSLNSIIRWDMDDGVKSQLKSIQKAVADDIAEYGKTNPEWYKKFKEADKLYGNVAKREELENLLSTKSTNYGTEKLSHNALSKNINTPEKLEFIKKQVNPEVFDKIQKLGTVVKAMAIKNKNVPNPSGTAVTAATLGLIGSIATNPYAFLTGSGVGAVLGAAGASHLLTDKKFLDLALKYAENPNKNTLSSMALNKRIKEVTGYSAVALQNALAKNNAEERK